MYQELRTDLWLNTPKLDEIYNMNPVKNLKIRILVVNKEYLLNESINLDFSQFTHPIPSLKTLIIRDVALNNVNLANSSQTIQRLRFNRVTFVNNIEHYVLEDLNNLHCLEIFNSSITNLSQFKYNNLKILQLINNNITIVNSNTFNKLINVYSIELTHNNIVELHAGTFNNSKLYMINLSYNKLKVIKFGVFNSVKIYTLDLSHNEITHIENNSFTKKLVTLNLHNNSLSTLDENTFKRLIHFTIYNNAIDCDCTKYKWILNYTRLIIVLTNDVNKYSCYGLYTNIYEFMSTYNCTDANG